MRLLPALPPKHRHGFSLVELSIVLVILGLLAGGILSGQSLIRAAELRSVTTQFQTIAAATQSFRDKYFALPGDMPNATKFWDIAAASHCDTTQGTGIKTCDGNGDGLITPSTNSNESFRYWQHLANAGLIEGSYTGIVPSGANVDRATKDNSPPGKLSNSLWAVYSTAGALSGNATYFNGIYNSFLEFGLPTPADDPVNPVLKPEEAWNIDTKLDDGKPGMGKIMIRRWDVNDPATGAGCTKATAASQTSADYNLSSSTIACVLLFPNWGIQ